MGRGAPETAGNREEEGEEAPGLPWRRQRRPGSWSAGGGGCWPGGGWAEEEEEENLGWYHVRHEKNYKKEDEHDGPVGTHDTNAHREPEYIEYRNYD